MPEDTSKREVWIYHINTSGCNGCDIELLASILEKYDSRPFDIKVANYPEEAEVVMITGHINWNNMNAVKEEMNKTPKHRKIMALGNCGISGGVFKGSYNEAGPIDKLEEVDMYIPGCPVKPEAILNALSELVDPENSFKLREPKLSENYRGEHNHYQEKCIYCGECARSCPSNAIKVDREKKEWAVDLGKCLFCGRCEEVCPTDAISFSNNFDMYKKEREALWSKGKNNESK